MVVASQMLTVTGMRGVVVAKRRTEVTFGHGLGFGRRISKVSTLTKIWGVPGFETQNGCHFWTWTCVWSSHLKSANTQRDCRVVIAKCRTVVTFGLACGRRISKVLAFTRDPGVLVVKRRTVVTFGLAFGRRISNASSHKDAGRRGRETQNRGHFWTWTWVWASHVKSVNSRRDGRVLVAKRRTVVTFGHGLAFGRRISKLLTVTGIRGGFWSRNAEQSSRLELLLVLARREKTEERRKERGERREEKRDRRGRRAEIPRGERREESREETGERRADREQRREERGERREERGEERGEKRKERKEE